MPADVDVTETETQTVEHFHHKDPDPASVKISFTRNSKGWTFDVTISGAPSEEQMNAELESALYLKQKMIEGFPPDEGLTK